MSKFASLKDGVIYRKSLDTSNITDQVGSTDELGWFARLDDLFGWDWIIHEDDQGFVDVTKFDHIDIDERGYFCPTDDAWSRITDGYSEWYGEMTP